MKSTNAVSDGNFADELIEIKSDSKVVSADGCIRSETSIEAMSGLMPVFSDSGTVTAATSSPLTDGAAARIVCSEEFAAQLCSLAVLGTLKTIVKQYFCLL